MINDDNTLREFVKQTGMVLFYSNTPEKKYQFSYYSRPTVCRSVGQVPKRQQNDFNDKKNTSKEDENEKGIDCPKGCEKRFNHELEYKQKYKSSIN